MSLTFGTAPFGKKPGGRFNFAPPAGVLYWDQVPKRMRAEFDGVTVVDSRRAMALHETGKLPAYFFPREDVAMDRLAPSDKRTSSPLIGEARWWSLAGPTKAADNAVFSYEAPIESAAFLAGWIGFAYPKLDGWWEEDDPVYAHPRDPYHGYQIHNAARRVVVRLGDTVVAESSRPRVLFETSIQPRFYLPPDDVRRDLLQRSETVSQCPYKGDGQHWHLTVGGETVKDAAWSLPRPIGEAAIIKDWICFYADKAPTDVDGERLPE